MGSYSEQTVGELVATKPGRARFFEKIGIDYCCGGKKPLGIACEEAKKDIAIVEAALEEFDRVVLTSAETDWTTVPIDQLIDHIVNTHHAYLKEEFPRLSHLVNKVSGKHGESHPELEKLHKLYEVFRITLEGHLISEEKILFPAIRELVASTNHKNGHDETNKTLGTLIKEHDLAGEDLRQMRKLTNDYMAPSDACNSYRAMLEGLESLERDTHKHVHLENNILFARASRLL